MTKLLLLSRRFHKSSMKRAGHGFPWKESDPYSPDNVKTPQDVYGRSDMLGHPGAFEGAVRGDSYNAHSNKDYSIARTNTFKIILGLVLTTFVGSKILPSTTEPDLDISQPVSKFNYLKNNPFNYLLTNSNVREESIYATSHFQLMTSLKNADDFFIFFHNKPRKSEKLPRFYTDSCVHKCSSVNVPLGSGLDTADFEVKYKDNFSLRFPAKV